MSTFIQLQLVYNLNEAADSQLVLLEVFYTAPETNAQFFLA